MSYPFKEQDLDLALPLYLDYLVDRYRQWLSSGEWLTAEEKEAEVLYFSQSLKVNPGRNYLKVVSNGSAHSFIVIKPNTGFKVGAILKAASWGAPATNFARGNILTGNFDRVRWTGA